MDVLISIVTMFWIFINGMALEKDKETTISGYTLSILIINLIASIIILGFMISEAFLSISKGG